MFWAGLALQAVGALMVAAAIVFDDGRAEGRFYRGFVLLLLGIATCEAIACH